MTLTEFLIPVILAALIGVAVLILRIQRKQFDERDEP